jgi:hypothetical protein
MIMRIAVFFFVMLCSCEGGAKKYKGEGTAYAHRWGKDTQLAGGQNFCGIRHLGGYKGDSSYFERCGFAALSHTRFGNPCGRCIRVREVGSRRSMVHGVLLKVTDKCCSCKWGDVDMCSGALRRITGFSWDRKKIEWTWANCTTGKLL